MPKPKGKRYRKKKRNYRSKRKTKRNLVSTIIYNGSKITHNPLPPRYFTYFTCQFEGYMDNTPGDWNYGAANRPTKTYVVGGNKMYRPFVATVASGLATQLPNAGVSDFVTPVGGNTLQTVIAVANLQCSGFSNLLSLNGPYGYYRVLSSEIEISLKGKNVTDDLDVVVLPFNVTAGAACATIQTAAQAQYAKMMRFPLNGNLKKLRSRLTTQQVFGTTKAAIFGEDNYAATYNGVPVNSWFWQINMASTTGTNLTTQTGISVKVRYFAMLEDYNAGGILDT